MVNDTIFIDEIKKLDVDIEKEVFVHGALCISYSGECLMSSIIMNRSGNRGECAGMCRLPYNLYEDKDFQWFWRVPVRYGLRFFQEDIRI